MRGTFWCAGVLASALAVGGCAHDQAKQDEAQLGHLSIDTKQNVYAAQNNLQVAQANEAQALKAREDARQFGGVAKSELSSAKSRLHAGEQALVLATKTGEAERLQTAHQNIDIAHKQLLSAQAKDLYSRRLVQLRFLEENLAKKQLNTAETELALTRAEVLQRNHYAPREDIPKLTAKRNRQTADVAATTQRVAGLRDDVERQRIAWEDQRRSFDVATRGTLPPPVRAPEEPKPLQPVPLPGIGTSPMTPSPKTRNPEVPVPATP